MTRRIGGSGGGGGVAGATAAQVQRITDAETNLTALQNQVAANQGNVGTNDTELAQLETDKLDASVHDATVVAMNAVNAAQDTRLGDLETDGHTHANKALLDAVAGHGNAQLLFRVLRITRTDGTTEDLDLGTDSAIWDATGRTLTITHVNGQQTVAAIGSPTVLDPATPPLYDDVARTITFTWTDLTTSVVNVENLFDGTAYNDVEKDDTARTLTFTTLNTGTKILNLLPWFPTLMPDGLPDTDENPYLVNKKQLSALNQLPDPDAYTTGEVGAVGKARVADVPADYVPTIGDPVAIADSKHVFIVNVDPAVDISTGVLFDAAVQAGDITPVAPLETYVQPRTDPLAYAKIAENTVSTFNNSGWQAPSHAGLDAEFLSGFTVGPDYLECAHTVVDEYEVEFFGTWSGSDQSGQAYARLIMQAPDDSIRQFDQCRSHYLERDGEGDRSGGTFVLSTNMWIKPGDKVFPQLYNDNAGDCTLNDWRLVIRPIIKTRATVDLASSFTITNPEEIDTTKVLRPTGDGVSATFVEDSAVSTAKTDLIMHRTSANTGNVLNNRFLSYVTGVTRTSILADYDFIDIWIAYMKQGSTNNRNTFGIQRFPVEALLNVTGDHILRLTNNVHTCQITEGNIFEGGFRISVPSNNNDGAWAVKAWGVKT